MCFRVILAHFWKPVLDGAFWKDPFFWITSYAVPTFVFISFYYLHGSVTPYKEGTLQKRCLRILGPHIGWLIIYVFANIVFAMLGEERWCGINAIWIQLITGEVSELNNAMWYMVDLFICTVLFILISAFFRNYRNLLLILLAFLTLFIEYSGINSEIMNLMSDEFRFSYGRLAAMIPVAVCGFMLAEANILEKMNTIRIKIEMVLMTFLGICFIMKYEIFAVPPDNGDYYGVMPICVAILFFIMFYSLPIELFDSMNLNHIRLASETVTRYTLGIYCMHNLVGRCLSYIPFLDVHKMGVYNNIWIVLFDSMCDNQSYKIKVCQNAF